MNLDLENIDTSVWVALLLVVLVLLIGSILGVRAALRRGPGLSLLAVLRKNTRRIWVLIAGTTVIIVGVIISPLPGPGLSVLGPLGLAIIATEFIWARRLVKYVEQNTVGARGLADRIAARSTIPVALAVCVAYWAAAILASLMVHKYLPTWAFIAFWPLASLGFTPIFFWAFKTWKHARAR